MRRAIFNFISVIILTISLTSQIHAGEVFRYNFENDAVLSYRIVIDSDLTFPELGNLAQLVNLDKLSHNVELDIDLWTESFEPKAGATVRVVFNRISAVMIAGDSAFVDDGSDWGRIRPGAEFIVTISSRGEIGMYGHQDSLAARQVIQTMQRFFPTFPEQSIDLNYSWSDSVSFELEMPNQAPDEIESSIIYTYIGTGESGNTHRFGYTANGISRKPGKIKLGGDGSIDFDNERGRVISNNGDIVIDAVVGLAAFGLPAGLGSTPVHIESRIELGLITDE